jgi:glyoxylase-like metal-dependent hydrolase (beta-lactamase superfamily II)
MGGVRFIMGSRKPVEIAPGVHWYSTGAVAGNICFVQSASSWVLIDTATAGQGRRIQEVAEMLYGAGARPAAILLTHVHPDHSGSALELARAWDCAVYLHPDELELATTRNLATVARYANPLDRGIVLPLLHLLPRRWIEAMMERESLKDVVRILEPEAAPPGLPAWTSITTPGHSPGHTVFFRSSDRVLIAGDALLTVDAGSIGGLVSWILHPNKPRVCEPPWYTNWNHDQALDSVRAVVRMQPQVLATGHGHPLSGDAAAAALRALMKESKYASERILR